MSKDNMQIELLNQLKVRNQQEIHLFSSTLNTYSLWLRVDAIVPVNSYYVLRKDHVSIFETSDVSEAIDGYLNHTPENLEALKGLENARVIQAITNSFHSDLESSWG